MNAIEPARRWPGYGAIWRWHFYAGLLCIPFILWLACTGSIYLWRPQIEALIDRPYAHVAAGTHNTTAGAIARAADRAVPGSVLHSYQLPDTAEQAVQVIVGQGTRETRVYVDPQTLHVLKSVDEDGRLMPIIFRLHGELLLGDRGSYLVELAASWAIVMIVSGLALWWPRGRGPAGIVYPRLHAGGRIFWRDIHAVTGFWTSLLALGFLISGLPWASSWGAYLGLIRTLASPTAPPPDWTTGQADALARRWAGDDAIRATDPHAGHRAMAATGHFDYRALDRLAPKVATFGLAPPVLIVPPNGPAAPWTARSDSQDRPLRSEITLDPNTGRILAKRGFGSQPLIDRVVGYGVAAHEGQLFGLANQILNMLVAIGLVMLATSGAIMWWRRKPEGLLGAPPGRRASPLAIGFFALLVLLGLSLPLLGASMIAVLLVERLALRRIPVARRWLGLRAAA